MGREHCTQERFLCDVALHGMEYIRDDGVYRHIRFRKDDTNDLSFDLITWPGHLCITGDMGTWVFSRINDMFKFFREERPNADTLFINTGYWSEKILAEDKICGTATYDPDKFRELINQYLDDDPYVTKELRIAVARDVLAYADDGEDGARRAAADFKWHEKFYFRDFWEYNLRLKTYQFIWCCYAIVWGIRRYEQGYVMAKELVQPKLPWWKRWLKRKG